MTEYQDLCHIQPSRSLASARVAKPASVLSIRARTAQTTHTLRELHRITTDVSSDLERKATRILQLGLRAFGLDIGLVAHIEDGIYQVEYSACTGDPIPAGTEFALADTYCSVVVAADRPHLFHNFPESRYQTHPCYQSFGLASYIGTPLIVDGERYGTLNFSSPESTRPFSPDDVDLLRLMAQWVSYEMSRARHERALAAAKERAERAREQAEMANRAKSRFLASVSHELRTPMSGVLGMAQLLSQVDLESEYQRDVETIVSAGQAMLTLLDDLLDFASIESGALRLHERPFSVADVIRTAIETMTPPILARGLTLALDAEAVDSLTLLGDAGRVRQILLNLLSNAAKFTDVGGVTVCATYRLEPAHGPAQESARGPAHEAPRATLVLRVSDTGIGIPADECQGLFERFQRVITDGQPVRSGTGLGLSICRQLCELMGGRISVTSEVGRGSTFIAELSLPAVEAQTDQPDGRDRSEAVERERQALDEWHVLVVEDNLINQKVLSRLLASRGFRVSVVNNGAHAIEYLHRERPDIILMDCQMPVMDGYQTTRRIRAMSSARADTPIVALTADLSEENKQRCAEVGMDGIAYKPIDADALCSDLLQRLRDRP